MPSPTRSVRCLSKLNCGSLALSFLLVAAFSTARVVAGKSPAGSTNKWWSETADQALSRAGTNQPELVRTLQQTPAAQRDGIQFLVENMPDRDLRSLSADYLLSHLADAYDAFEKAPWHGQIPQDIFLNDILPYACTSEVRDQWFKDLREKCLPLITDCKTPGEVAQRLNEKLFPLVHVKYSTQRAKAIQSPSETMASGMATCSGLSILLVDACRSVGVPARVTGTPMWTDNSGNHCWVEVWDSGVWHFTGAAEPDPKGLDHGWFEEKASAAKKDSPRNAIYASSFRKTGIQHPGWLVGAVNVTERYAKAPVDDPNLIRLLVRVLDQATGKRVVTKVTVTDAADSTVHFEGTSRDETADLNDILPFRITRGHSYDIHAEREGQAAAKKYDAPAGTNGQEIVVLALNNTQASAQVQPAAADGTNKMRLLVKVLDQLAGKRVAAKVTVTDIADSTMHFEGTSRDETVETNDILAFTVTRGRTYDIRVEHGGQTAGRGYTATPPRNSTNAQAVIGISLSDTPVFVMPKIAYTPPAVTKPLKADDEAKLSKAVTGFFTAPAKEQAAWKFPAALDALLRDNEPAVRRSVWKAYKVAPIHAEAKKDYDTNQVRFQEYLSPYTVKDVGTRPANGWPLFIAMHGGGNAGKQVNDSQWKQMQIYYKDHPEVGGYRYLALRAPNDTWNGFYDVYVYPLIANLIRQFTVFGNVNPDKVFIMGYSHGGYGAFAIGPKEPDLFAAIHASAGAPTDGETTGKTLRNTIFTCMVGEKDTAYGRFERDQKFRDSITEFRAGRSDVYPVTVSFIPDNPHTGLPDRDKIREMYPAVRNPVPRELTWLMTDKVITDFFWIRTDAPDRDMEIDATCRDNRVTVTATTNVTSGSVLLDSRLIDFKKPVTLELNGKSVSHTLKPSLKTLCETLQRRGDPELSFTTELPLPLVPSKK
jgi:pimeloyl-ACP methyl ester carboxylesterase